LLGCYLPWTYTIDRGETRSERPAGYHFIFDPPQPRGSHAGSGVRVDVAQAALPMIVVGVATAALAFLTGGKGEQNYRADQPATKDNVSTSPDNYEILQVSRAADPEVIEAAYRRLVEKWQSDRRPGDPAAYERLAALDAAYAVLSDPTKRGEYDRRPKPAALPSAPVAPLSGAAVPKDWKQAVVSFNPMLLLCAVLGIIGVVIMCVGIRANFE
jgi:hypothetical protein